MVPDEKRTTEYYSQRHWSLSFVGDFVFHVISRTTVLVVKFYARPFFILPNR